MQEQIGFLNSKLHHIEIQNTQILEQNQKLLNQNYDLMKFKNKYQYIIENIG